MTRRHMKGTAWVLALACAGAAAAGVAWAQSSTQTGTYSQGSAASYSEGGNPNQLGQITVSASHGVHEKQVGASYTGIPIEQVSLSRQVSYRGLDLNSPSGRAELDKRIENVAREACHQLQTLYPLEQWDTGNRACVAQAVRGAKEQVATITASAH